MRKRWDSIFNIKSSRIKDDRFQRCWCWIWVGARLTRRQCHLCCLEKKERGGIYTRIDPSLVGLRFASIWVVLQDDEVEGLCIGRWVNGEFRIDAGGMSSHQSESIDMNPSDQGIDMRFKASDWRSLRGFRSSRNQQILYRYEMKNWNRCETTSVLIDTKRNILIDMKPKTPRSIWNRRLLYRMLIDSKLSDFDRYETETSSIDTISNRDDRCQAEIGWIWKTFTYLNIWLRRASFPHIWT